MRRTFELAEDNAPVLTTPVLEITTTAASGSETFATDRKVSWAIISSSNVTTGVFEETTGPYFWIPDGSTVYNIRSSGITNNASADYDENSLEVFLNGQQLTRDLDYEEILDGSERYRFQFINVGTTGLPILPSTEDRLSIVYRQSVTTGSLSGNETVYISAIYPNVEKGFTIAYENFGIGETIKVQVVYR